MESRLHFSTAEKRQDMILGIAFLFITAFSSVRIVRNCSPTGGRKVITTFNILIFIASAARALWFLLPNNILETSYTPEPLVAFVDNGWKGALISEILLVVGSLSLYGIFILVACYWVNMLRKLNSNTGTTDVSTFARFKVQRLGTLETFTIIMSLFAACQALNIVLYLSQVFNSEQMILYDSILLTVVSVAVVAEITILSNQIQVVLQNLEAINNRNSQPQIRRIFAIIVVANMFFVTRVILECTLAVCLIQLMKEKHSFAVMMSDRYWSSYILLKHLCEVIVLTLELIISTAIKSYDTGRPPRIPTGPTGGSAGVSGAGRAGILYSSYGTSGRVEVGGSNGSGGHTGVYSSSGGVSGTRSSTGGGSAGVEMRSVTERTPMLAQYDRADSHDV